MQRLPARLDESREAIPTFVVRPGSGSEFLESGRCYLGEVRSHVQLTSRTSSLRPKLDVGYRRQLQGFVALARPERPVCPPFLNSFWAGGFFLERPE